MKDWNGICECGHLHSDHAKIPYSPNYSAGACIHCKDCKHFCIAPAQRPREHISQKSMELPNMFSTQCSYMRTEIKKLGEAAMIMVKDLKDSNKAATATQDTPEMIANTMLAFRHLEDAAMRFGKAIQAFEGEGKSIYDDNDARRVGGMNVTGPAAPSQDTADKLNNHAADTVN